MTKYAQIFHSLAIAVALALVQTSAAESMTISDGTFADADWSHVVIWDETPGGATVSAGQQLSGGNPDAYQQGFHGWGPGNIAYGHIFDAAGSYDPSTQGAILNLEVAFDFVVEEVRSAGSRFIRTTLLLEQDSRYYFGIASGTDFEWTDPPAWTSTAFTLTDANFREVTASGLLNGTPDFSSSGSPIEFGYLTRHSTGITDNFMTWGIDNYEVTVNVIPLPAAAWLFGSALIGLLAMRRKVS